MVVVKGGVSAEEVTVEVKVLTLHLPRSLLRLLWAWLEAASFGKGMKVPVICIVQEMNTLMGPAELPRDHHERDRTTPTVDRKNSPCTLKVRVVAIILRLDTVSHSVEDPATHLETDTPHGLELPSAMHQGIALQSGTRRIDLQSGTNQGIGHRSGAHQGIDPQGATHRGMGLQSAMHREKHQDCTHDEADLQVIVIHQEIDLHLQAATHEEMGLQSCMRNDVGLLVSFNHHATGDLLLKTGMAATSDPCTLEKGKSLPDTQEHWESLPIGEVRMNDPYTPEEGKILTRETMEDVVTIQILIEVNVVAEMTGGRR